MFVKEGVTSDVTTTTQIGVVTTAEKTVNSCFSGNNLTTSLFRGKKKFVPICHFCNKLGHIRPKCFKYQNIFKMSKYGNFHSRNAAYKPKNASKHKIDLKRNNVKKVWIKKSNLMCYVTHTSLKVVSTNLWYFDNSCSKHMTGDKNFLIKL